MSCDRFEREALILLERGEPLDPHFSTCSDCQRARVSYERLKQQIGKAGIESSQRLDWTANVWAEIERKRRLSRQRRAPWVLAATLAALLGAAILWPDRRPPAATVLVAMSVEVEKGTAGFRGLGAQPGDLLVFRAETTVANLRATQSELRIYRNDHELILRCRDEPPCIRRDGVVEARLVAEARGAYRGVFIFSDQALPLPTGMGLDSDHAAVRSAGGDLEMGDSVDVR